MLTITILGLPSHQEGWHQLRPVAVIKSSVFSLFGVHTLQQAEPGVCPLVLARVAQEEV